MSAPDVTLLGTYKIVLNSNGNMAMGMNCGEGCGALGDMVASNMGTNFNSVSDSQQTFQTSSDANTRPVGFSGEVTSRFASERDIWRAEQDDKESPGKDASNVKSATERVKEYLGAHPEELQGDVKNIDDLQVVYADKRGPGNVLAHHDPAEWFGSPGPDGKMVITSGSGIKDNTITLFLGSGISEMQAMMTIFHELGHHSPEALRLEMSQLNAYGMSANLNTPAIEDAADKFAGAVFKRMPSN
jgi:hypothetical protein